MGMTDQEKIKYFKVIVIVAVTVMTVMGVLLFYDNYKLYKAQNAYSQGWNECASSCNAKISILNQRCNIPIQVSDEDVPIMPPTENDSGVVIQITS